MSSVSSPRASGRILPLALILLLVLGLGLWWWLRPAAGPAWQTDEVRKGDIEASVSAIGTLQPLRSVEIGAQVSGQVLRLHVQPGDVVEKGRLLAEIDASVFAATVAAGRAQLAGLRAQLEDARAQRRLAGQQHNRQQQMAREEATRLEDLETAAATLRSAAARIAQVEAQIAQMTASLRADEARLGYARLYAPFSGTVTGIDVKEGQTLNATYQTPTLMRIADLSRMTVWTDVSEADIRRVRAGLPAHFSTLAAEEVGERRRWTGTVRQVLPAPPVTTPAQSGSSSASPTAGTKAVQYTVLFDVDNPDGALMAQMTAQVSFVTASAQGVLAAPLVAFKAVEGGAYETRVLTEGRGGQDFERRRVSLGRRDRVLAEVLDGLKDGDRVIVGEAPVESGMKRFQW